MTTTGTQPLMVDDDRDDAVFTSLGNSTGFRSVINRIDEVSDNTTEKGDLFEKVVKAFIRYIIAPPFTASRTELSLRGEDLNLLGEGANFVEYGVRGPA